MAFRKALLELKDVPKNDKLTEISVTRLPARVLKAADIARLRVNNEDAPGEVLLFSSLTSACFPVVRPMCCPAGPRMHRLSGTYLTSLCSSMHP